MTRNDLSSWEPRLLEREYEQEKLSALMRDAQRGAGSTVLVEAGAGAGKSRLVQYVRARAAQAQMRVLSARASELELDFPYAIVHQLFDPVVPPSAELPLGETPFSALQGLHSLCLSLSEGAPLLLTVDDAHWADTSSLRFLLFLSLRLEALPLLLVVAARPMDADAWNPLTRVAADPSTHRIEPGPLGAGSAAQLLSQALGSPADTAFSSACHDVTRGNPFLLTELARSLAAEKVQPTAANASAVSEIVPEAITRAAVVRLGRLPSGARDLARAVATLGDDCERRHAAALAGIDLTAAGDAADSLRRAEILAADASLRFVHPLVRNAIQSQIPPGVRSREHQRAAVMLERDGAPPERIAVHLLATEPADDPRTVQMLYDASRRAHEQGAPDAALAYLLRALREPARDGIRGDVLELLVAAGLRACALPVLMTVSDELLAELMSDPARLMRCAQELATCLIMAGQTDDGRAVAEQAIEAADEAGDFGLAVALEVDLAFFTQMRPAAARQRLRQYEHRVSDRSPEQRLLLAVDAFWSCLLGGPAPESVSLARRALRGEDVFRPQRQLTPIAQAILVLARADELDAAADAAAEVFAVARARGSVSGLAEAWYLRGLTAYRRGDLRSAEADARQAATAARLHQSGPATPFWHMLLVDTLVERADLELAQRELEVSGMTSEVPDGCWLAPVLLARARLRLAQDRPGDAVADVMELRDRQARWGVAPNPICPAATLGARALLALGERDGARELAEEGLRHAQQWGVDSSVADALAAMSIVTAGEEGIELAREAVERAAPTPAKLVHASALLDLGTLLRRERQPAAARDPLRVALDLARRCGAVALARRAAGELGATGVKAPRYSPIGADELTPSEQRVAELAARGLTNREIATTLFVTIKTVESHLRSAYDKLGIDSRRELHGALTVTERRATVASLT